MLLECGMGLQRPDWHVLEEKPPMYTRVYYVLSGDTVYHEAGFSCKLQCGYLYIFPAHIPYEITTSPTDPLHCLHLHLDLYKVYSPHLISICLKEDSQLASLMDALVAGMKKPRILPYLECLARALEELCLSRHLFTVRDKHTATLLEAVRAVYRTSTSLSSVASACGYSEGHFTRVFKKAVGISPHQCIISMRMSDAIRLLATDASLDQIAEAIGYADGRCFANAFRNYYGVSPSTYRAHYVGRA